MSSRNLNHHLQSHGRQWRVRLEIPAALRPQFGGQRFLIRSLGAVTQNQARLLRGPILSDFEMQVAQARNPDDPTLQTARMIRRRLEIASGQAEELAAVDEAEELASSIEAQHGPDAGSDAYALALGVITPLTEHLEEWIADQHFTGKTALQHRKAFKVLTDWCRSRRIKTTLQSIDRIVAWEFIEKHLRIGKAEKTTNRYLSSYRTHWAWLMRRTRVHSTPWTNTHIPTRRKRDTEDRDDEGKTAFEDGQVTVLIKGSAPEPLPDLMLIAALTGARINAICDLRVRDCQGGAFTFKRAKKEPRDRTIPIHSKLRVIITRRTANKKPDEFIFEELPAATPTRPRSAAASQAFTRYRRTVGVGADKGERSRYDFHSFRRWFTTKAEQADQPPHIIDFVTGHKRPGETLGRYSKGPSMEQMKACVEAIKLPSIGRRPSR